MQKLCRNWTEYPEFEGNTQGSLSPTSGSAQDKSKNHTMTWLNLQFTESKSSLSSLVAQWDFRFSPFFLLFCSDGCWTNVFLSKKRFWKDSWQLCQSLWLVAAKVNGKKGAYSTLCCFGSMSQPQSRFSLDIGWIADLQGVLPAPEISDKGGYCGTFAMEMAVNYNCSQEK